jgi:hypothetical protein
MKHARRSVFLLSLLAAIPAEPMLAFDYPLSSEAIREAYFLGHGNSDKRNSFFASYRHDMPMPERGPRVALIQIETPFACLVDEIGNGSPNDHAQEAEQKYLGKPAHFRLHVEIYFTPTYPSPDADIGSLVNLWEQFKIHFRQDADIEPRSIRGQPIYADNDDGLIGIVGATIDAEYDVDKIDAGSITAVEVDTPDGQKVETAFPLNELR